MRLATCRIRKAVPRDAERLTEVAHAAKRHWKYPARWIRLWRDDLTVRPRFISTHAVYCAVRGRELAGFYALSGRAAHFELEHLWVHPAHLGSGVGTRLFAHALKRVRAAGGTSLEIASDPNAQGFYRKMGARPVGFVPSRPRGRRLPLLVVDVPR